MSDEWLVSLENVSKKFCKRLRYMMLYGLRDLAKEIVSSNRRESDHAQLRKGEFWALRDVSFEVKRGECLGIIGPNGAGKTTLLKLIDGILRPDSGTIRLRGRLGALIELGAGFHPMLSGRENIYVNGAMLGMSKSEMNQKFDAIVEFSGIGDFLDAPVKTYSSGMNVRLGFSIAIHTDPDILLIDEVLAVGDAAFQRRCQQRIAQLLNKGAGLILVSHNMTLVQQLSTRTLLLMKGTSQIGSFADVYPKYLEQSLEFPTETKQTILDAAKTTPAVERQTGEVEIKDIRFFTSDRMNEHQETVVAGQSLVTEVVFHSTVHKDSASFSISFYREDGVLCFVERSGTSHSGAPELKEGTSRFLVRFESLDLRPGIYAAEVIINDRMSVVPMGRKRSSWLRVIDSESTGTLREHAPIYRQKCVWKWED